MSATRFETACTEDPVRSGVAIDSGEEWAAHHPSWARPAGTDLRRHACTRRKSSHESLQLWADYRRALLSIACLAAGASTIPALAQSEAQSATARATQHQVEQGDAAEPEHALESWGGVRTRLSDEGVDLSPGYLAEIADVASGGLRHWLDYAHQIKLQADIDGGKLLGLGGFSLHTALVERAGRNASADYLGDDLFEVQEIYGGTKHAAAHLVYRYGEQLLAGGRLDPKVGRMDVGQDFAASPLYCSSCRSASVRSRGR